jgi:HAD superfamily hydrolase (TIGR01509 family)
MDPPDIVERLLDDVVIATEKEIPWRPGARELLASLAERGVPCALVTMSYTRLADTMIAQLPPGTFAAVVTGDQVSDGKPHPEAYLTAAARLGADPRDCVAIEDSPTGIASATAAGCVVVGIPHHVAVQADANVRIVDSLTELSVERLNEFVRQP